MASRAAALPLMLALAVTPLGAQAPPRDLGIEGAGTIPLAGYAVRTYLLGTLEVYGVAVYAQGLVDRDRLASPEVAKAVRIDVRDAEETGRQPPFDSVIRRRLPFDWRGELVPALDPGQSAHLRGVFAPLLSGDVVLVEYAPGRGTTVRVNRGVAVNAAHHDFMLAFLDHWLGPRPVSEEIKDKLLGLP